MSVVIKSPINRIGGKNYLTSFLSQYIPEHTCYVESFCGAGHLLFSKLPSPVEILNDSDGSLVNMYQVIKNNEKRLKFIQRLNETPYSRSVFQSLKHSEPENEIEKAVRYFYLCRASFASDIKRGGFAMPSKGTGRNPAMTYQNSIDALEHIAERLRGVTIECLDYADCIQRYDSPETLFYCDPPYLNSEHYYGDTFTERDHYRLSELLHDIKGQAMITHYSNELYDTLYKGWNRYEYQSFKGSHKAEPGTEKPVTVECLYTNFEPLKTRSLFDE